MTKRRYMGCFGHADVETDDFYSVLKQERCQMRCSGPPYAEQVLFTAFSEKWSKWRVSSYRAESAKTVYMHGVCFFRDAAAKG